MSLSRFFAYSLNITKGSIIAGNNTNTVGNIFTTGGNVGIGTTAPSVLLDVAGTSRFINSVVTNSTITNLTLVNSSISSLTLSNAIDLSSVTQFSGSFSAANNVNVATDVTGFQLSNSVYGCFTSTLNVRITTSTGQLNSQVYMEGTQASSGWLLNDSSFGDSTDIAFTLNSSGQLLYTSTNQANWISTTFTYVVNAIKLSSGLTQAITTTGNAIVSGNLTILDTTDIGGSSTPSLAISGGLSVDKRSFFNNNVGIGSTNPTFNLDVTGTGRFTTGITTGSLEVIGLSDTLNLTATNSTLTNLISTNITSSNISCTTFSGSNLNLSGNLNVAGTLTVVNITSTNLVDTNLTAGVARITSNLSAIGNSNTIGNFFTTGGNIGIGTTNPLSNLDIWGVSSYDASAVLRLYNNASQYGRTQLKLVGRYEELNDAWSTSPRNGIMFEQQTSRGATINLKYIIQNFGDQLGILNGSGSLLTTWSNDGNVGIGTGSPLAKLHINGGAGLLNNGTRLYFRYNDGTSLNYNTGGWGNMSIYATSSIACADYFVSHSGSITASDSRIKINIQDINSNQSLSILRQLKPKTYQYKDNIKHEEKTMYGFVAQEIKTVVPDAVHLLNKEIPNIFELANVSNGNKITLTKNSTSILEVNDEIMLYDSKNNEIRTVITEIIDDHTFTIDKQLSLEQINNETINNKIFVYGQIINDFHHLNKEHLFTITTSALQAVDQQLQTTKDIIHTQQTEINNLKSEIKNLKQTINDLILRNNLN